MATLANDLVQFLMHLFGNPQATLEFLENPERALADHGLGNVGSADVDAAMPVVLDYAPITVNASFDRDDHAGSNGAGTADTGWSVSPAAAGNGGGDTGGAGGSGGGHQGHDDHAYAVQQLHHVVNHYSYTASTAIVDDRVTITDQSVSQNIWADGDVEQWFDNDAVVASGDQAVAAGGAADVRDSNNIRDAYNTDGSTDNSTDNQLHAGAGISIGNEATSVEDSFNTDVAFDMDDSFNDNSDNSDHSGTWDNSDHSLSTAVADSFNQEDSFNEDNSTDTAVDVSMADSFQDNSDTSIVEDNGVAADNQPDFTEDNSSHTGVDVDVDHQAGIDDSVIDDSTAL
ncbi:MULTISPECIES: IniB N-terminal domain-containing protein [unclassified Arthrobacter]|uniref:IniB N-terminal domain-containing protein n=1 Tax=unclassified Arthrobacter TaxID=235627 RepID=UPI001C84CEC7|nr:IniB N-terminal domain-containing protein [Arthrobacter sp. MAHUQ-56]MBX7444767.1 MSCRAMM family adhesin SdrC [Arthrobacter sp. MAHUQ-56]